MHIASNSTQVTWTFLHSTPPHPTPSRKLHERYYTPPHPTPPHPFPPRGTPAPKGIYIYTHITEVSAQHTKDASLVQVNRFWHHPGMSASGRSFTRVHRVHDIRCHDGKKRIFGSRGPWFNGLTCEEPHIFLVGGDWNHGMDKTTFHINWESSSQLTNSYFSEELKPPTSFDCESQGFRARICCLLHIHWMMDAEWLRDNI